MIKAGGPGHIHTRTHTHTYAHIHMFTQAQIYTQVLIVRLEAVGPGSDLGAIGGDT